MFYEPFLYCISNYFKIMSLIFFSIKNSADCYWFRTDVEIWPHEKQVMPKEEIIKSVKGKSAIFCCLNDKIDKDVLHAAGKILLSLSYVLR